MKNITIFLRAAWRIIRWPIWTLLAVFIAIVIYRFPLAIQKQKDKELVAAIHAQRITIDDVMGAHLPPTLDPTLASSTIAGIDANHNGIRDDVELVIFALHPDSAKVRAAELQYALELQNELVRVVSTATMIAAAQEAAKGYYCLDDTVLAPPVGSGDVLWEKHDKEVSVYEHEIKGLLFNTIERQRQRDKNFEKISAYSDMSGSHCDIDPTTLPN